ncbi:phage minor tail protein L [Pandoraea pneumonica]|uniref:Phage minor tail protein L n=1 Tax=Pandoraea pneumonica TaxID=2508299 RepID=A0A5E4WTK0_9BURK|nr:phage minor tail protein L [Pandoraea pneumonica]VVE28102.1 phage minor tail protein L [Pandoraea pneumonica]
MPLLADIQTLSPGGYVEMYELDATSIEPSLMFHFHGYPDVASIWWRGVEYTAWPILGDGFALIGEGQQETPTVSVGDFEGAISAMCVLYEDLVGAVFRRRRTLAHYLDARNFPEGNPSADPSQGTITGEWRIEQKTNEEPGIQVDFELASLLDFGDAQIPARTIVANWCDVEEYRGPECGYTGTRCFDRKGNPVDDPSLDACGRAMSDCKLRFGEWEPIPFRAFPGAGLNRS